MNYILLADVLLSFLFEVLVRVCVRDAIYYKRNKKARQTFYRENSFVQHVFRAYTPRQSFAPRNMTYFQILRILNILEGFIQVLILAAAQNIENAHLPIFLFKIIVLFCPFVLYCILLPNQRSGLKEADFSIFKKP